MDRSPFESSEREADEPGTPDPYGDRISTLPPHQQPSFNGVFVFRGHQQHHPTSRDTVDSKVIPETDAPRSTDELLYCYGIPDSLESLDLSDMNNQYLIRQPADPINGYGYRGSDRATYGGSVDNTHQLPGYLDATAFSEVALQFDPGDGTTQAPNQRQDLYATAQAPPNSQTKLNRRTPVPALEDPSVCVGRKTVFREHLSVESDDDELTKRYCMSPKLLQR